MHWIEGINRTSQGLTLQHLAPTGHRTHEALAALGETLKLGRTTRTKLISDCSTWKPWSPEAFWELAGIAAHKPRDNHAVYRLEHEGRQFLVPASVLLSALIRPIKRVHRFLFKPQGLESFCVPLLDDEEVRVGFLLPTYQVVDSAHHISAGIHATYSWMYCFPSARKMWDSVYTYARGGHLNLTLPKARLTLSAHSVHVGAYELVTELVVLAITATEAPLEFAANHPRDLACHESNNMDWRKAHNPVSAIPSHDGDWSLSDEEWATISAEIYLPRREKYDTRQILDTILTKLGSGTAWRKLDYQGLNFPTVQTTYQRMVSDGRWTELTALLQATRGSVPT